MSPSFGVFRPIRGPIKSCHMVVRIVRTLTWHDDLEGDNMAQ
jgi:hypothetical protein